MRGVVLAIFLALPAWSQTMHGLGFSSKTCVDLDGDGYGTGPLASLVTTASGPVAAGLQTVGVGTTTGLVVGQRVRFDSSSNLEFVVLTAVSGSTITGTFLASHAAGVLVSAGTKGDGSLWFPGYASDDPGCLGLDADDRDSTVQTAAQGITKYGSLAFFLAKIGRDWDTLENDAAADQIGSAGQAAAAAALLMNTAHTYWLAPATPSVNCTGTTAQCTGAAYPTNSCISINSPCLTISNLISAGYKNTGVGGDLIIARDGWGSSTTITMYGGSSTRYNGFWSYPGEHAVLTVALKLGAPNSCVSPTTTNYVWVDGLRLKGTSTQFGGAIVGGSCDNSFPGQNHDVIITHNNGTESDNGGLAPLTGFSYLNNWTVAYNTFHDDNCPSSCNTPHGIYLGDHQSTSTNMTIRRNLIFRNSFNGLHWNGHASGFYIDQNVSYDNGVSGLDFAEGLVNSYIRSNLVFNNAKQITFTLYPGNCPTQTGYIGPPLYLCPGNITGNLIENNTVYHTGNANISSPGSNPDSGCPAGINYCAKWSFAFANTTNPETGSLGSNIFRNNVITSYGDNNAAAAVPVIYYETLSPRLTCSSTCTAWPLSTMFDHNQFWQTDGKGGANVLWAGADYTVATAGSITSAFTSNSSGDPQFVAEAIANWNVESYFDLRLLPSSPALQAGSATGIPDYDALGRAYAESGPGSNPSLGALERNLYSQGWTTLTGAGLSPAVAPGNGAPDFTNCLTPSGLNTSPCPPGGYPFQGVYTSEFTAWTDGIKREKPGSPKQLVWWGGGHSDYIGNEMYAISVNRAAPSIARIIGPSTFTAPGMNVLQTWSTQIPQPTLSDGSANTRHTPGNLAYDSDTDKMGLFGGALAGGNGVHTYDTWEFNFGTLGWERFNSGASNTHDVDCSNYGTGFSSCSFAIGRQVDPMGTFNGSFQGSNIYDPLTKSYWVFWGCAGGCSVITQYYPTLHQHVVRATSQPSLSGGAIGGQNTRVFISDRRWLFTTDWNAGVLRSWILDVSGVTSQTPTTSPNPSMVPVATDPSCNGLLHTPGPGLVYLPAVGRILGFPAGTGGNTYYLMDPATWTCTSGTFAGGPPTSPLNQYIIGKMQYFTSLDSTVLVNDVGANVPRVLNLNVGDPGTSPSGGTPPPPPPSPVVSFISPGSGATVSGAVTLTVSATTNLSIAKVQFQVDGVNFGSPLVASPYLVSWNTLTVANGTHALSAFAVDSAGNTGTSPMVTVTVSNVITSPSSTPPTNGLLGYWNFDEDTGTAAHDASGNGYNGTVMGAPWVPGKINSGLSFNGGSNYVLTSNMPMGNALSVSAWVNSANSSQSTYSRIAETKYTTGVYLGTDSSGTKYKFIVNGGTGSTGSCGGAGFGCAQGGAVTTGWHLVTGTYDGTDAILYVDNAVVASDTFTTPPNSSLPLYVGRYFQGGSGWKGVIDEVRLYNRALAPTEVVSIYNYTGAPPSCDLNGDGVVNNLDVQIAIAQAVGTSPCTNSSLHQNGQCNVIDVQRVVNASLGATCKIAP